MRARGDRYNAGAIAFHWTIAALILFNLWLGLFHDALPREWRVVQVLPVTQALSQAGRAVHGPLGYLMAALLLLHVVAALRHHLLLKDKVLVRMLPVLRR